MASQKKSAIRMLFDSMDRDGTGDLDIGEIKQLAEVLFDPDGNRQLTEDEYAIMMENMDEDGSGVVSFVEFSNWWVGLGLEVQMQNGHQVTPACIRPMWTSTCIYVAVATATVSLAVAKTSERLAVL
jgi:hypothetical protein